MVHDAKLPGLAVRITPTGAKSLILYRWINGGPQIVTLGRFPALSVEKARQVAQRMNGRIADRENPMEERRAARKELTLGQLFIEYLERHAKARKRTWKSDQDQYRLYLSRWENKRVSEITRLDVHSLHSRIAKDHGPYVANRLLSLLSVIFNQGRNWGVVEGENPVKGLKRYKEQSRERFLRPDELPRFFQALTDEPSQDMRDFILLSLFTGGRKGNVLGMRWIDLNLERGEWQIPAEDSKSAEPMTIPLTPEAMSLLTARKQAAESSPWVFPGRGKTGHLRWPRKGWERILKRAGLTNLRLHDLRRTLGSWQAAAGANLSVIGKSLGHKSLVTTAIYSRLSLDPVRESVNAAVTNMLVAGGVIQPAVPVPIHSKTQGGR